MKVLIITCASTPDAANQVIISSSHVLGFISRTPGLERKSTAVDISGFVSEQLALHKYLKNL